MVAEMVAVLDTHFPFRGTKPGAFPLPFHHWRPRTVETAGVARSEADDTLRYCDSYSRLPAILDCHDAGLPLHDTRVLLGEWCSLCDNIGRYKGELEDILPASPCPEMMTSDEETTLASLPDLITIHRGVDLSREASIRGICWSLERAQAERFPFYVRYLAELPGILTATVRRDRITALKSCRQEGEIVTFCARIRSKRNIERRRIAG